MYSRSYSKNTPFTVPRQYSGVAFSRPREGDAPRSSAPPSKPPVSYSREAGERLYAPGDLPKINIPMPCRRETEEKDEAERTEEKSLEAPVRDRPSFRDYLGSLGDDTLMILALILLLFGCEDAEDTVILLILLLLLG